MTSKKTDCNFKKNDCCLCLSHSVLVIQSSNITTDHTQVSHQPPFKKIFSHVHPFKVFFFPVEIESSVSGFSDQWFSNQWSCSQDTPIFKPMQNALYLFLFFFISFWTYFKMKAPSVTPTFFFLFIRSSACLYLTSTASSDAYLWTEVLHVSFRSVQ